MVFKNLLTAAFLTFTLVSIVATSYGQDEIDYANLHITSDCVSPTMEMNIVTEDGEITDPVGVVYSDFGFPADVVRLDSEVRGVMGSGELRVCKKTYGNSGNGPGGGVWIFSCEDEGRHACSIMLEN